MGLKIYEVKRFLFEKPLASSLSDIQKIEKALCQSKAASMVNLHLRHSRIPQIVSEVTKKYSLGNIISIVEYGGAKCFGTNGIHWLDLASHLIGERPESVSAKVDFDSISPRGPQFLVADGFGVWSYPSGAKFHLIYSNSSSTPSIFRIQWKHAMGTLIDETFIIEIQTSKIENPNSPIVRTPDYDLKLEFDDIFFTKDLQGTFGRVHDFLLTKEPSLEDYSDSSKALLCAFISSALNRDIDLNMRELLMLSHPRLFRRDWKVT
jgi:predicted dehydrogenase